MVRDDAAEVEHVSLPQRPSRSCPSCAGLMLQDKKAPSSFTCKNCGYGLTTKSHVLEAFRGPA